jgi:hypothetical protein
LKNETKQQRIDREERERVEASNKNRELDRQRTYVAECDLILHQTRERVAALRKEAEQIEKYELPKRERKLTAARVKLVQMECAT